MHKFQMHPSAKILLFGSLVQRFPSRIHSTVHYLFVTLKGHLSNLMGSSNGLRLRMINKLTLLCT